jgi:hypothetical protein
LQRVGRRRRRRRSRQSRERSPKTKLPYTPSRVHTQVATEFVFCLESIFHTNGRKHRTLCSTEPVLGSEEPAAPDMKSHDTKSPCMHRLLIACLLAGGSLAAACMPTRIRMHSSAPRPSQPLHACVFVCNAYSYALKCSVPRASMHTNAPGKCSFKTPF